MENKEILIMREVLVTSLYGTYTKTDVICVFKGTIRDANKFCKEKSKKSRNCFYFTKKVKIHEIQENLI